MKEERIAMSRRKTGGKRCFISVEIFTELLGVPIHLVIEEKKLRLTGT